MTADPQRSPALGRGALWLALAVAIFATGLRIGLPASRDAEVRAGIVQSLLDGQTPGRQGIVSSIWWPPLPTLLAVPLTFVLPADGGLLALLVLSAFAGGAALILIERCAAAWGAGSWRWLLVAGVGLNPQFLAACWSGSSAVLALALLTLCAGSLITWIRRRHLGDLAGFGLGAGLLVATSAELVGWILAAVLLLVVAEARRRAEPGERQATLILALLPSLYVAALWALLSWLIMGDPLYLVRSLIRRGPGPGQAFLIPDRLVRFYGGSVTLLLVGLVLSIRRHNRAGIGLALLGLALPGVAAVLASRGLLWSPEPLLLVVAPVVALALAHALADAPGNRRAVRWAAAALPLALVLVTEAPGGGSLRQALAKGDDAGAAPPSETEGLLRLEQHVRRRSTFVKVFVCGYDSFALLRGQTSPVFVHALDFDFNKAKRDYRGHALYVLVHRPEHRSAMDSVHWKYRSIFIQGGAGTLYDRDWGEWRLFELIQAPALR